MTPHRAAVRRALVATAGLAMGCTIAVACARDVAYPDVTGNERFVFPRDHGAHPDYRTEWWYVTGALRTASGDELGFQVTFFRSRLPIDDANPSRFAPRQLLFAHAAIADPKVGHLLHDQRIARSGFGIAEAAVQDADVTLDGWRFARIASPDAGAGALRFHTRIDADGFMLDLDLDATEAPVAQGADAARPGYSQKGPSPRDASRYYSVPQLAVSGRIARGADATRDARRTEVVTGRAWLDREWSSAYLDAKAGGWDWVGLNLDDGGSMMAFQMRDRAGAMLWAGGMRRFADGRIERYRPEDVRFTALRSWTSARSGARWPVLQRIVIGAAAPDPSRSSTAAATPFTVVVEPLMDDQELDSRASTGTIYWEGAVRVKRDDAAGPTIGRGYLELTGYWKPIRFDLQSAWRGPPP